MRQIIWNDEPGGNIEHVEEHGFDVTDIEHVLRNPESEATSHSSGLPCVFGYTLDGTYIIVIFEEVNGDTVYPVTAYEVPEPGEWTMGEKFKRIVRPATAEERERHARIREQVTQEFPPLDPPRRQPAVDGIGAQIRAARQAQGLTRYALAKKAGLPDSTAIRDIEYGSDTPLSLVRAVAEALGLELSLVEPTSAAK